MTDEMTQAVATVEVARIRLTKQGKAGLQPTPGLEVALGDPFVRSAGRLGELLREVALVREQLVVLHPAVQEVLEALVVEPVPPLLAPSLDVDERPPSIRKP